MIRESQIERRFTQAVKQNGGWAVKLFSPGMAGMPDRLVLLPGGQVVFVEMKAPGKRLRPLQRKRKRQLEALGFAVYVVDSMQAIERFIGEVMPYEI